MRYRGKDEAYAVNEIYQKLRSEIQIRRENKTKSNLRKITVNGNKKSGNSQKHSRKVTKTGIIAFMVVIVIIFVLGFLCVGNSPGSGYYRYNGDCYYRQGSIWYQYDDYGDYWYIASEIDDELYDHYSEYYEGSSYNSDYGVEDFSDTSYYDSCSSNSDYNDDWDGGDWDWGGDWDAGDTDWDTDW